MLPTVRPRFLHPDHCHDRDRNWNNNRTYSKSNNYNTYCSPQTFGLGPPPLSPMGLKEVLSSYTPGPTVIMIEKKKKISCFHLMNWRLFCISILCIFGFFVIGATLHSNIEERSNGFPEPILKAHRDPFTTPHQQHHPNDNNDDDNKIDKRENHSNYVYLNRQMKNLNVILSFDDDEESYVEDVVFQRILPPIIM